AAAEEIFHPRDHVLWFKGLCENPIAPRLHCLGLVHGLESTGQQHDRNVSQPRRLLDMSRYLVPRPAWHADVRQHNIRGIRLDALDRLIAVTDRDDLDILVGKRQLDDALNRDAVVGEKQGLRHSGLIGAALTRSPSRVRLSFSSFTSCFSPAVSSM